jgi:hypothetical protein
MHEKTAPKKGAVGGNDGIGLDDRFHETGLDEASIYGTGIRLVDSSFEKN